VVLGPLDAYREVVDDGVHAVSTVLEAGAIASAVSALLADEARRRRIARAARGRVESVASLPREIERVEALYARAAATVPRPCRWRDRLGDVFGAASS
jgi:glycosyltransferase involved in cell wall biosynthesis